MAGALPIRSPVDEIVGEIGSTCELWRATEPRTIGKAVSTRLIFAPERFETDLMDVTPLGSGERADPLLLGHVY